MDEAEELRDRAIRWRSIALFQSDQMARDALGSIAAELERRAAQLEAEARPQEPP
jgi:hypothetical protein